MGKSNQGKQRKPIAFSLSQNTAPVWFQIIRLGCSTERYSALAPPTPAPPAFTIFLVQWDKEMKEQWRTPSAKQQKCSPLPGGFPGNTVQVSGVSPLPYKGPKISGIVCCSSVSAKCRNCVSRSQKRITGFPLWATKTMCGSRAELPPQEDAQLEIRFSGSEDVLGHSASPGQCLQAYMASFTQKNPCKMPSLAFLLWQSSFNHRITTDFFNLIVLLIKIGGKWGNNGD